MRSHPRRRASALVGGLALLFSLWCPFGLAADSSPPSDAAVARAVDALRTDPNLSQERKARRLRWRTEAPVVDEPTSEAQSGGRDFLSLMASAGRVLMWLMVAAVLAFIGVHLSRYSGRWRRAPPTTSSMPTHVQGLDIRSEGLPEDVGAAALALWQRGERRACLALLYRGLLSRLVHAHAVPITASSTEGDCLLLARTHLPEPSQRYTQQLVSTWQQAVYGAREPDDAMVRALCDGFATAIPASTVLPSP